MILHTKNKRNKKDSVQQGTGKTERKLQDNDENWE